MATKNFVDYSTPAVDAAWLNDVDEVTYEKVQHVTTVSPFMATVLDDTTASAARTTLGAGTTGDTVFTSATASDVRSAIGATESGANTTITSLDGILIGKGAGSIATNSRYGTGTLVANTTGSANVAIGPSALAANTIGSNNVAIGSNALLRCTTTSNNIAIGTNALSSRVVDGGYPGTVAIGYNALQNFTTGTPNIAIGPSTLSSVVTAGNNIAIGDRALTTSTADYNIAIGTIAGYDLTSGQANTIVGGLTTGLTTGSNNIVLGYAAQAATSGTSNSVTLGNSSISVLRCQVTSITALSDARDKKDITDLEYGLSFVNKLRPVSFKWNTRDGAKVDVVDSGFIAQELKEAQESSGASAVLNLVYEENPDKLEATYGRLLPVLVKAIQELSAKVEELEARCSTTS